ncbi:hypothetical protein TruAng_004498 [Truncatella angustata]|nr:hypothetical protein TruAng_004498 [Truncatella angustata]
MSRVSAISQMYPPTPGWTEKDISDLSDKVYIVTGSNAGVGKEVAKILYSKNATVYAAARNEEKNLAAINATKEAFPSSTGRLEHLHLDLGDLNTIKKSADTFLSKEKKLHVLFNNAGVMLPPQGSKTAQGYELQLGTNCVGPFLFTKLLTPLLIETAKTAPKDSVRVVWVSSSAAEALSPKNGLDVDNLDYSKDDGVYMNKLGGKYGVSKAGNYYHATEYAKRHREDGVISIALNPGNLASDLDRHIYLVQKLLLKWLITYPPIHGAYTELFAGISDQLTLEKSGGWIVPWGRFSEMRADLVSGSKLESEGGSGIAQKFWEWSEDQVRAYV